MIEGSGEKEPVSMKVHKHIKQAMHSIRWFSKQRNLRSRNKDKAKRNKNAVKSYDKRYYVE